MATDREVVTEAPEPVNEWEHPGDLFEPLEETAGFLHESLDCEYHEWQVVRARGHGQQGTWCPV